VPTLIQEQNGFAGLTNKIVGKKALKICVAYDNMERFFPADRIVFTGNPIRKEIVPATPQMKEDAYKFYGLNPEKKHIFVVGGSLGSATLNNAMKKWIEDGCPGGKDVEVIWQCGKYYKASVDKFMEEHAAEGKTAGIQYSDFIQRMDLAYAVADVVISRSGASSVSELCAANKATIFVPSPNVAEDHQTHNAMALVRKDAAMIIKDIEAPEKLLSTACELIGNPAKIETLEKNIAELAKTDAAMTIAKEVYTAIGK
jgi:UDP-N-acetylglucosamine--N-acetylmuramyl-(pentapeptide) pyrophosphoryl-undecaprenol N-acetylglucosamine transferase